jgi:hypothetical protein
VHTPRTAQTCGGVNGGRGLEVSENVPATENDFTVLVTALIIWKHLSGRPECGFTHLGKDQKNPHDYERLKLNSAGRFPEVDAASQLTRRQAQKAHELGLAIGAGLGEDRL